MSGKRVTLRPAYRRAAICDEIESRGTASVEGLANKFDTSMETIRRDLNALADAGRVRKVHGGATRISNEKESAFGERVKQNAFAKQVIAKKLAGLISPGQTLFIDTGSTTLACAESLAGIKDLTVITNSFRIADVLTGKGCRTHVIILGGTYQHDNAQTVGAATVAEIGQYRVDHAVLTIGTLDRQGVFDFSADEAQVARAMCRAADQLTIVADCSKLNRRATYHVCDLHDIGRVVLDTAPDTALWDVLRSAGVEVV